MSSHVLPKTSRKATAVVACALFVMWLTLAAAAVNDVPFLVAGPLVGVASLGLLAISFPTRLTWRIQIAAIIVVILVIPIRRYALPGNLPFQLEPYRLLIAFVGLGWLGSLLADRRVRFYRSAIFAPLITVVLVCAASIAFNVQRIQSLHVSSDVVKLFTFLLSFAFVFFLIVSVVKTFDMIDFLLKVLVGGGAVVSVFALIELETGFNIFNHLDRVMPFLEYTGNATPDGLLRGGRLRVFASAQHPIGLGELLVLLIPMGIYLAAVTRRKRWLIAAGLLGLAALGTVSRTAIVSLGVIALVYLLLRPRDTLRFWPLILPGLLAVHLALPGVLGAMYKGLFPKGGLIAQEAGAPVGSSRTASFGPGMHQVKLRPLLGGGYGSRIPVGPGQNSFIVDDQWLSTAMDTGVLGVASWLWLFTRFVRRMFRAARLDQGPRGWLFVGAAAAVAGFAIGMATYDSFSFIQATLVLFMLLALGCAGLRAKAIEEGEANAD
jgi:polysaccharide biosynthesis protein PslJ